MQPSFSASDVADARGPLSGRKLPVGTAQPEESSDDFDDTEEDFTPSEKRDDRWWRDFGADFEDEEPEPAPGDFWPESDET
jgi:hypothetical protein